MWVWDELSQSPQITTSCQLRHSFLSLRLKGLMSMMYLVSSLVLDATVAVLGQLTPVPPPDLSRPPPHLPPLPGVGGGAGQLQVVVELWAEATGDGPGHSHLLGKDWYNRPYAYDIIISWRPLLGINRITRKCSCQKCASRRSQGRIKQWLVPPTWRHDGINA